MIDEAAIRARAKTDKVTHITTGVAVVNGGRILVVRRVAHDDTLGGEWELPGGGVDLGETIEQGALRELFEETGLKVAQVIGTFEGFDYRTSKKPKARQINFKVTVEPGEIKLTEHDKYRWITSGDIPGLKTNTAMQHCLYKAFA